MVGSPTGQSIKTSENVKALAAAILDRSVGSRSQFALSEEIGPNTPNEKVRVLREWV